MEQLYSRQNYFSMRQNLKLREQELEQGLRVALLRSDVRESLFEYLVVKREALKEALAKAGASDTREGIKELQKLIDLFAPSVEKSE